MRGRLRFLTRNRWQLLGALLIGVLLPAYLRLGVDAFGGDLGGGENTILGTTAAMLAGAYLLRRMGSYPGVYSAAYVIPVFAAAYTAAVLLFFFLRLEYWRFQFLASYALVAGWFIFVTLLERRLNRPRLTIVPLGDAPGLLSIPRVEWTVAASANEVAFDAGGLVADFRAALPPDWEKLLARAALKGIPVYDSKQVQEFLTGRVQIQHLSENNLGSLLPSSVYSRIKRSMDLAVVVLFAPPALIIGLAAAVAIKLGDRGSVFFRQDRIGYRGEIFSMLKFRTMRDGSAGASYTEENDRRVTKVGRILRRYRIDELPQIVNIVAGHMSWIGPRPEARELADKYEAAIPYYSYRHIVRPGITGWAQVNQGNVASVRAATDKLHYDFFYIKHFSPWLDILISIRTVRTIITGFGAL